MKKTVFALAVAALLGASAQASATTLTFDALSAADDNFAVGTSYVEQGFQFDDLTPAAYGFAAWGSLSPFSTGSTALINNNDGGLTRLAQVGGAAFNLVSIDLAAMYPGLTGDGAVTVTFTGTRADHSTVTQSFAVNDGAPATFAFSGFSNLTAVTWSNDAMYHQFDNIHVAAVPEPESYAMFLAGLGMFGFMARRRSA